MACHNNPWESWLIDLAGISAFDYEPLPEPERTACIEDTYAILKEWPGQDFGYSADAWRDWMMRHTDWDEDAECEKRFSQIVARRQAQAAQCQH